MITENAPTDASLSTQPRRPGRRRLAFPVFILLVLLPTLVILAAMREQHLFDGAPAPVTPTQVPVAATGPFVQSPLTPAQVNDIMHLVGHMKYRQLASLYVSHMSLDEELGQLFLVEYNETGYSPDLEKMISQLHAGGVILYKWQMFTFDQTKNDIVQMKQHAKIPLFISTDEEGGWVDRLGNIYPFRPSASQIGETGDINLALSEGQKAARDMAALGINNDFAPDTDVMVVAGPDELSRDYGTTPEDVIKYAGAYMQGLQSNGIVACIKHFPGLGAATIDAHEGLPVINRSRDDIYSVELAPYKAFIHTQNKWQFPGMIMPTDLLMPAIDPVWPAELSHTFMTDILRKEFGYDGVVITDALYMQGISDKWSLPEAGVLALNAGNDMLLGAIGSDQMLAMLNALKVALHNGTLSKARVDEAVSRILALKMEYHIMPTMLPSR